MPIRLRLAVLFALGTATLIVITGLVFSADLRVRLVHSIDSQLRQKATLVAAEVNEGTVIRSPDGRPFVLAGSLTQVYDATGSLVGASGDVTQPLLSPAQATAVTAPLVETTRLAGKTIRLRAVSVRRPGGTWVVAVGQSTANVDNALHRIRHAAEYSGPPAVALAGLAAWLLAGGALRPVERMRREVAQISELGGASAIVVPGSHDEIANLATTMNDVLGRLKRALDRERRFVADAGHELRTPLAILQAELELAGRPGRSYDELAAAIESTAGEVARMAALAEDLLAFGRDGSATPAQRPVAIAAVARDAAAAFAARAGDADVRIHCRLDESVLVIGHAARLRRAVDNLVDNALRFAPTGSAISIVVARTEATDTTEALATIEVTDQGPGFPVDFLPDAFERFRRADDARNRGNGGSGLGLALVREIAAAHHGRAVAGNRPDGGASVRLELPCARPTPDGSESADEAVS